MEKLLRNIEACWGRLGDFARQTARLASEFSEAVPTFGSEFNHLRDQLEELVHDMQQGSDCGNYKPAFKNATRHIRAVIDENPTMTVEIKVLAVAASFSWDWIVEDLLPLLLEKGETRISLELLLVDPDFVPFQKAGVTNKGKSWADLSGERVGNARNLFKMTDKAIIDRFQLEIRYYGNLPHWHGVLIQDTFLLLGRATWEGSPPDVNFRVGENAYGEYSVLSDRGVAQIEMYKNWFHYYAGIGRLAFPSTEA